METRVEVKTFKVQYRCPKCESGHLEYIGTKGVRYVHKCNNKECNHHEDLQDKKYPYIEYEIDKAKLLDYSKRGYIVCELHDKKCLLYGYPTGEGGIWQCYGDMPKIVDEQQQKVKLKEIYFEHEVEVKEIPLEGTILSEKVAFIKSLM